MQFTTCANNMYRNCFRVSKSIYMYSNSVEGLTDSAYSWPHGLYLLQKCRNIIIQLHQMHSWVSKGKRHNQSLEQSMCRLPILSSSDESSHREYHPYSQENTATQCSISAQGDSFENKSLGFVLEAFSSTTGLSEEYRCSL